MRAPIQSTKHYVLLTLSAPGASATLTTVIADAAVTRGTAQSDVVAGSIIKAVYIEEWMRGAAAEGAFNVALIKIPGTGAVPTFAQTANYNDYENKKNILYMTQGLAGDDTTSGLPVMKGWFKIPKGKQRFGLGDRLVLMSTAIGVDVDFCGFMTYKEYN